MQIDNETENASENIHEKNSPYLTTEEAAARLRLAAITLRKWRAADDGPPFRMHGDRVVYHIDDIDAWSVVQRRHKTRARRNTSDVSEGDEATS